MLRSITLPQVGAVAVGHQFRCERLASGHVLVTGHELAESRLLDPSFAVAEPVGGDSRAVAAIHVGVDRVATSIGGELRLRTRAGAEKLRTSGRGRQRAYRFTSNGVWLWELARRRRWVARLRRVEDGKIAAEAALPEADPTLGAWSLVSEHPLINAVIAKSVDRHVAIEHRPDGALEVRPLALDVFIDWLPDGRSFLAATFDGRLTVHRWPGDTVLRTVATERLADLFVDQLGLHGRVIDDDRALLDTLGGRLMVVDLVDPTAEVIEVRLTGDARPLGLSWLELGRSGRILTGRAGDDLLRVWDGTAVLRSIPSRAAGLR
ncbi:MAG TPA: hypothetical protein VM734_02100 [Kofleriaceae bacterium]|nr:hypothetical protein [Kofleriaceae bacterium]